MRKPRQESYSSIEPKAEARGAARGLSRKSTREAPSNSRRRQEDPLRHLTFVIGKDGIVYQKDLGEKTTDVALALAEYNPGDNWTPAI